MTDVVHNSQKRSGYEYEKNVRGDTKMCCLLLLLFLMRCSD